MPAVSVPGSSVAVKVNGNTIAGMGSVSLDGVSCAQLDDTAFGDTAEKIILGMMNYGTLSVSGNYKVGDTTGQDILKAANLNKTLLTNMQVVLGAKSWVPNSVADSNAGFYVQSFKADSDKSGLTKIAFTLKANGPLTEV